MSSATLAKIEEIEQEMARTQKNKATAKHLGSLKAKLAKLRREVLTSGQSSGGGGGTGFEVQKAGDTRVGLIGFPSVGKSTLLSKLTNVESEVAAYEFTTLTCIPGVIYYKGAKIQLLDLPGIIEGAKDGKGRGKQIIGTARTCNVLLIVLDVNKPLTHRYKIEKELAGFGIRLNQKPPHIKFKKKDKGGINFFCKDGSLGLEEVKAALAEFKIHNADIRIREPNCTIDQLIDVVEGSRVYMPALYVLNKIDSISIEELDLLDEVPHYVPVSSQYEWNFDVLLEHIWEYAQMLRLYTKPKGQIPDYSEPVIMHARRPTIAQFCDRLHKGILPKLKYAWVWGASVKHQPQKVGKDHVLEDEDVVQLVKNV
eukprot:g5747.t1